MAKNSKSKAQTSATSATDQTCSYVQEIDKNNSLDQLSNHYLMAIYRTPTWTQGHSVKAGKCVVLDKFQIELEFYERVVRKYIQIRPYLISMGEYTMGDLLGEQFVASLTDHEKRLALLCLKQLATGSYAELMELVKNGQSTFMSHSSEMK